MVATMNNVSVIILFAAAVASLAFGMVLSCDGEKEQVLPYIVDGEMLPYRSDIFMVKRPADRPYPDLVGSDLYAFFIDGPGGHVRQLTDHVFENAWLFTEEKGAARINGLWGFIDRSGDFIIPPQFAWAEPFSEALAAVKHHNRYGYIDHSGNFVIDPQFLNARFFARGLAPVLTEDGWIYIDKEGRTVIPGPYEQAESFSFVVDLAAVKIDSKWGYINSDGSIVIPVQYDNVWSFFINGISPRALVAIDSKWFYIDSEGVVIKEASIKEQAHGD